MMENEKLFTFTHDENEYTQSDIQKALETLYKDELNNNLNSELSRDNVGIEYSIPYKDTRFAVKLVYDQMKINKTGHGLKDSETNEISKHPTSDAIRRKFSQFYEILPHIEYPQQIKDVLHKEYKEFLKNNYTDLYEKDSSLLSDPFYAYQENNRNVFKKYGVYFWKILDNERNLQNYKQALIKVFEEKGIDRGKDFPDSHAHSYYSKFLKLKDFFDKEYGGYYNWLRSLTKYEKIDFENLVMWFNEYAGKKHSKDNQDEAKLGKQIRDEFTKYAKRIIEKTDYIMEPCSQWQHSGNIKHYLWIQFKHENYKDKPYSISLGMSNNEEYNPRIYIKTEIVNNNATKEILDNFAKTLNVPVPSGFKIYDADYNIVDGQESARQKLSNNETNKIMLEKEISTPYLNERTNEIIDETISVFNQIVPNYMAIFKDGEGEETMKKTAKNQILYGPPGTGKTYNTIIQAMEILGSQSVNMKDNKGKVKTDYSPDEYKELKKEFDNYKNEGRIEFITFHQSYSYEEFVEGIKPYIPKELWKAENMDKIELPEVKYIGKKGVFREICNRAEKDKDNNYVLIIDEINRGNISKIFGELITLIEEDKRENVTGEDKEYNTIKVRLPYSQNEFSVPNNLYIIGTMNTSDRSIASVDIALRRRFKFKEMMPKPELVADFGCGFKEIFKVLNKKISILLDRDHQIGHSYFIKDKYEHADRQDLKYIWFDSVMPLLNEYFYGDWEKLQEILGVAKEEKDMVNGKYTSFIKNIDDSCIKEKSCYDNTTDCFDFVTEDEIDFKAALDNAFPNLD